ncbi:MAG: GGDEF domain-containing protein, partial [Chloroflexi bacterium]|nr:GGDEF domain-containing protein [Chloroflexota bacterium]
MPDNAADEELRKLRAITGIHYSIGPSLDLVDICRISIRGLVATINCDASAILQIEKKKLKILAERGFTARFGKIETISNLPAIQHILDTKEPIFSADATGSLASGCTPRGHTVGSLICSPIIIKDTVRGFIHVSSAERNAFSLESREFIGLLARELSIAMERSFLYSSALDIAIRDGLTGCYNRRKFDVDIVAEIAAAKQRNDSASLLMLDIFWFKKYNDYHGHPRGDVLLKQLVSLLRFNTRPFDKTYRYGGEEFAILLLDADKKVAAMVAQRLRDTVWQEKFEGAEASQPENRITVSIGVASYPEDSKNATELIASADSALYQAKKTP